MSFTTLLITAVAAVVVLVVATLIVRRFLGPSVVEPMLFDQPPLSAPPTSTKIQTTETYADAEVQQALAKGNKIAAIKRVRELTGVGLKEAKDYVDALIAGKSPPSLAVAAQVTPNMEDVASLAASGRKIEAIKRYRELTGVGLKEAKDYVDQLMP